MVTIIIIGILGIGFLVYQLKEKFLTEKLESELEQFKLEADQIVIDLNKVNIMSNSWSEDEYLDSQAARIDQAFGDADRTKVTTHYNINVVSLKVPYKGDNLTIESRVNMELTTLKMKLLLKGSTTLYLDPNDPKNYYLDLDFLK